ncbi:MAG TPA: tetratricopeptide repeat protein, partial [Bacteroidia bacterium]|nr:tetratricopeptide repeat protein [Bacteroidia bacterium]
MTKRSLRFSFAIFIFSIANSLSAQMNVDLVNSGQIMQEANMYYSMGKFSKAENLYLKVGRNDTNYAAILRDLAYTYSDDKEDSLALVTARRGKELDSEYKADFYNIIGISLKELEKYDTAIATFNEGIRLYPYKYLLQYQKGMCYFKMKKYPEAQACFEKSIELNPYNANSHYYLGKTCAEQGRIVPAILSYQYFLLLENNTERAAKTVTVLEDLYAGDTQADPDMELSSKEANDGCFDDIKDLIAGQSFLQPTYKNKTIIKLKMVKGLQALLEKLHYEKNTDNWWMENYVPFFVELQEKDFLAPYASHILYGVRDNPTVAKSIKKNKKKIIVFATWASGFIKDNCKHPARDLFPSDKGKTDITFYDNHVIAGAGQVNAMGVEDGDWMYFFMRSGHLLSRG